MRSLNKPVYMVGILVLIAIFCQPIMAKKSGLLGKRYISFSYGLSSHRDIGSQVSVTRLTMNIPLTRKLDIAFGSFQGWSSIDAGNQKRDQRDYTFFSQMKYHFLPHSIINPFLMLEMGQSAVEIDSKGSEQSGDILSSSLLLGGDHQYRQSHTAFDFYYSAGIGEEFLFNDKFSIMAYYGFGKISQHSFQYLVSSVGYWILEDFFVDLRIKFHFDTPMNQFHLVGNLQF